MYDQLKDKIEAAIQNAIEHKSKLIEEIHERNSLSSWKIRHLLNNIGNCLHENAVFLEVGTYHGISLICVMFGNLHIKGAYTIDNWCYDKKAKANFLQNIKDFVPDANIRLIEENCKNINLHKNFRHQIDFMFYDADHSYQGQYDTLVHLSPIFNDRFVCVIDDWGLSKVRRGVNDAFRDLHYDVLKKWEFFSENEADPESWWNGILIAIVKK